MESAAAADALIVSGRNPLLLEMLLAAGTARQILPVSRRAEYASKLLTWRRVENPEPAPLGPFDHRCPGLIQGGAQEALRLTAVDDPEILIESLKVGRPVLIDGASLERAELDLLHRSFEVSEVGPGLYKLNPGRGRGIQ